MQDVTPRVHERMKPSPAERVLRKIKMTARRLTSFARPLPDAVIIGAAKAGSSSALYSLIQHPDMRAPEQKELHYLDTLYHRGESWYRGNFDLAIGRRSWKTAEATPHYLSFPLAPERMKATAPDTKLIVILRDPVDRAVSHLSHRNRLGGDDRTMREVLDTEGNYDPSVEARFDGSIPAMVEHRDMILPHGLYSVHLERWFAHFDRDQFLIIDAAELFADQASVMQQMFEFVGLRPWDIGDPTARNQGDGATIDASDRNGLADFYHPYNEQLFTLLDRRFDWA